MRCLEDAAVEAEVDAREVDQADTEDEELRSPYVVDDELDLGRWAHDAAVLALPARILCRPDCAGLCPTCGESLNDADPRPRARHRADPRWAKLKELKLDAVSRETRWSCAEPRPPRNTRARSAFEEASAASPPA